MKTVQFKNSHFKITIPDGWKKPGIIKKIFSSGNPELYGPNKASMKFAIGNISPSPTATQHIENITNITVRQGYDVLRTKQIEVDEETHASIVYDVQLSNERYMIAPKQGIRLKNYHLIFSSVEYVITCLVSSIFSGQMLVHAYEDEYDEIVKTFRIL